MYRYFLLSIPRLFCELIIIIIIFFMLFLVIKSFALSWNQLILVGVCCSGRGDGIDPYDEVALQSLPEYRIPSDDVTMTCITCTNKGQIFLSGQDGHIYEIQYTTGSSWQKCCRKVCLTSGFGSVISRYYLCLPSH